MTSQEPVFEFPLALGAGVGGGGLVHQLHAQLRAAILDRRLLPGAKLPSTRRVALGYGLARNTVIAAYDLLVAEGYVLTRAGAKAEVADLSARSRPCAIVSARPASCSILTGGARRPRGPPSPTTSACRAFGSECPSVATFHSTSGGGCSRVR